MGNNQADTQSDRVPQTDYEYADYVDRWQPCGSSNPNPAFDYADTNEEMTNCAHGLTQFGILTIGR